MRKRVSGEELCKALFLCFFRGSFSLILYFFNPMTASASSSSEHIGFEIKKFNLEKYIQLLEDIREATNETFECVNYQRYKRLGYSSEEILYERIIKDRSIPSVVYGYWRSAPGTPDNAADDFNTYLPWPTPNEDKGKLAQLKEFIPRLERIEEKLRGFDKRSEMNLMCHYMGSSTCRLCSKDNGSSEYIVYRKETNTKVVWPEGYIHYLKEHNVMPENTFMEVMKRFDR